jgi:glycosyltransferase involved in cell wall biosynthesis
MTEQPLVSIIIPTYNRAHLIGETLDSVLAQTYTNWECIVVDDGSTDATDELMAKYCAKDSRIRYYHRPDEHLPGGNGARNYGFKKSKGEYINFLDSDDLIKPKKLVKQVNRLNGAENVVVCLCKAEIFKENGELIRKKTTNFKNLSFFEDYVSRSLDMGTIQPLWRKRFLSSKPILFDENLKRGQEYEFFARFSISKNFVFNYVDEFLVLIRVLNTDRITPKHYNCVNHSYLLDSFQKVNQLILNSNIDKKIYKKFLNIVINKILISVQNRDYSTPIYYIQNLKTKKYRLHFTKMLFFIRLLRLTKNKGFFRLKPLFFIK